MANSKKVYWEGSKEGAEVMEAVSEDALFQGIWPKVEARLGSFTRLNAAKYYEYARAVRIGGVIMEIGVDQGRSATVLLEVAKRQAVTVHLVDSWESVLVDNYYKVLNHVAASRPWHPDSTVQVRHMSSQTAAEEAAGLEGEIDLVLIDANHYGLMPGLDCELWLPMLRVGGVALFHDYGSTFPDVDEAVDRYTGDEERWEDLGAWDSLAVRRKRA